jgi:hypothetical protein
MATPRVLSTDPLGALFYGQLLGSARAVSVVKVPNLKTHGFTNVQAHLHWSCVAQEASNRAVPSCPPQTQSDLDPNAGASPDFEFMFSLGNGSLATNYATNDIYVMI